MVGGAVVADEAAAVDREDDRQALEGDVVDDRVEHPLQERRVDGAHRPEAGEVARPQAKTNGVLLGDADVVGAVGERAARWEHPRALDVAAVMPTTRRSRSASATSAWPKTSV